MITFQPLRVLPQDLSDFHSSAVNKENQENEKLSKQLNQMFKGMSCPEHPEFRSVVLVNLREELDFLHVVSSCCTDFKAELEGLAEPQKQYAHAH
jgi:hypothetical protein